MILTPFIKKNNLRRLKTLFITFLMVFIAWGKLVSQIPKDTLILKTYIGHEIFQENTTKVKKRFSFIHRRYFYKSKLTRKFIRKSDSTTIKKYKSIYKSTGGDALDAIGHCEVLYKNGNLTILKYFRHLPLGRMVEINNKGRITKNRIKSRSGLESVFYKISISK